MLENTIRLGRSIGKTKMLFWSFHRKGVGRKIVAIPETCTKVSLSGHFPNFLLVSGGLTDFLGGKQDIVLSLF